MPESSTLFLVRQEIHCGWVCWKHHWGLMKKTTWARLFRTWKQTWFPSTIHFGQAVQLSVSLLLYQWLCLHAPYITLFPEYVNILDFIWCHVNSIFCLDILNLDVAFPDWSICRHYLGFRSILWTCRIRICWDEFALHCCLIMLPSLCVEAGVEISFFSWYIQGRDARLKTSPHFCL